MICRAALAIKLNSGSSLLFRYNNVLLKSCAIIFDILLSDVYHIAYSRATHTHTHAAAARSRVGKLLKKLVMINITLVLRIFIVRKAKKKKRNEMHSRSTLYVLAIITEYTIREVE